MNKLRRRTQSLIARHNLSPGTIIALVNVAKQQMSLYIDTKELVRFPVSTAKKGTGNRENSLQTPLGLHRIREKIGEGAPIRRIFRDRIDTGLDSPANDQVENRILTRILRLEGLEDGINRGPGIDTWERYIYIHGTNREDLIGTPFSHGCICMKNKDILKMFAMVEEGTLVVID